MLGVVAFVPLHVLHALGASHGTGVAGALLLSLVVLLIAPKRFSPHKPDWRFLSVPISFYAFHLVVALGAAPFPHLALILLVTGFAAAINLVGHRSPMSHDGRVRTA